MSMTISVYGIKPKDKKFEEMFSIYQSCKHLNIEFPKEVREYFGYENPDEKGVIINIEKFTTMHDGEYAGCTGYDVDLSILPEDIKTVRFQISY